MNSNGSKTKSLILNTLQEKIFVKQEVNKSLNVSFDFLKKAITEITNDFNQSIKDTSSDQKIDCNIGQSHIELLFGTEVIVFSFQNLVFEIDKGHSIWSHSYIQDNPLNAFVGIISVHNFIRDSFMNNQNEDLGYLIARIFINQENHYFVEGKRQLGFLYNDFSLNISSKEDFVKIIHSAMLYCLDFEMLVPPYEDVSIISVEQIKLIINKVKFQSAKRLGFQFYKNDTSV
jgi:hypothetical protein